MTANLLQVSKYGKALYYPHIAIEDVNWLKLSLLYWDGLYRIVPESVEPSDSGEIRQIIDAELLTNVHPREQYVEEAGKRFQRYLLPSGASDSLSLLEGVKKALSAFSQRFAADRSFRVSGGIKRRAYPRYPIYTEKIADIVVHQLERNGLANRRDDVIELPLATGCLYMLCLSMEISKNIGASPVTDELAYGEIGEYLSIGEPLIAEKVDSARQFSNVLLKLNLEFPTPESLADVPISKILKFREHHKDERKRFRLAVEKILTEAEEISDPIALSDFFHQERDEIQSSLRDHRRILDELNVKTVTSLFGVSAPTAIAATAGLTVPPVAAALTVAGIGVSLVNWWAEARGNRREKMKASPWHYLLSTKQFT